MKNNQLLFALLLFSSLFAFSSCQKDDTIIPENPTVDCPALLGNIGTACETPDVPKEGIITADCECAIDKSILVTPEPITPEPVAAFDCADLGGNIGDACKALNLPQGGIISSDCNCVLDRVVSDHVACADLGGNIGEACKTLSLPQGGIISSDCNCVMDRVVSDEVTCVELGGNIGDACQTVDVFQGGIISSDCNCVLDRAVEAFDCPALFGNVGDICETPDVPQGGTITADCGCAL